MWFAPRMYLLKVITIKIFLWGVMSQKTPHFGAEIGTSTLNLSPITSEHVNRFQSSIAQTMHFRGRKSDLEVKKLKIFWGVINKNTSPKGVSLPKCSVD
jgi:hypothetical protein